MKRNGSVRLKTDPRNARKHGERNKALIRQSLEEVGAFRSIAVDGSGIIRAGNGVYEQAQALGLKVRVIDAKPGELIAVRRPDLKGKRAERAALLDNRAGELSEWDSAVISDLAERERELLEGLFDDRELREIIASQNGHGEQDAEPQFDRAAELQKKWRTASGQLWRIGAHRLLCGDSTRREDVERIMGGEKAQSLITDPPYSSGGFTRGDRTLATDKKYIQSGTKNKKHNFSGDNRDQHSWISWCERWLSLYLLFVEENSPFGIWTDWRQLPALTDAIQGGGWIWRGIGVWDKTEAARPMYGRFRSQAEFLVWGSCGNLALNDGRPSYPGVITKSVDANKIHQTQKPVEVVEWSMSMVNGIVIDPFLGSGTTLVACEHTRRLGRGIEISPAYCAVTLQRMQDSFGEGIEIELLEDGKAKRKAKAR